jgi:hypothetical protein
MIVTSIGSVLDDQPTEVQKALSEKMKLMEGTVQLRAEIDESGTVTSFYLDQKQKNLVALCFELPQGPVKPGDTWPLHINLIMMGNGFAAKEANRSNRVKLISLSPSDDGDIVATLEYTIAEDVDGTFRTPGASGEQPCSMSASFYGQARFLVRKGRWQDFKGRMHIKSTGAMETDMESNLVMTPMKRLPEKLIELE